MPDDFLRMTSGIPGLDDMIEGGFPFPSVILLAGGTGTGKTTFCLQFLSHAAKNNEKGLYFTALSETPQWMLRFISRFDFIDKDTFGRDIEYIDLGPFFTKGEFGKGQQEEMLEFIDEKITEFMPQRIVIDPITVIGQFFTTNYRSFLFNLSGRLKNWQCITLLTGESKQNEPYPLEVAYTADGVIILHFVEQDEERRRYIEVLKMRGTDNDTGRHAMDFSGAGLSVQAGLK
jgi:circadian clock protein KaiC